MSKNCKFDFPDSFFVLFFCKKRTFWVVFLPKSQTVVLKLSRNRKFCLRLFPLKKLSEVAKNWKKHTHSQKVQRISIFLAVDRFQGPKTRFFAFGRRLVDFVLTENYEIYENMPCWTDFCKQKPKMLRRSWKVVRVSKRRQMWFSRQVCGFLFLQKNEFLFKLHFITHFDHDFFSGAKKWFGNL